MNSLGISVHMVKFVLIYCLHKRSYQVLNTQFGQILHVDKTCFLRPGHIYSYLLIYFCNCLEMRLMILLIAVLMEYTSSSCPSNCPEGEIL